MGADPEPTRLLLGRIEQGDEAARERLFERMRGSVLRLVRRRMGKRLRARYDTEDLAQSVLAEAVQDLDRFEYRGDGALARWLTRRVENKLRQRARGLQYGDRSPDRVVPVGPREDDGGGAAAGAYEPRAGGDTPSVEFARAEDRSRVLAAVAALPEREQRLVRMRDLEGRSWDEIVDAAGEPTKKAAQQCHARAWARLAAQLVADAERDGGT